MNKAEFQAAFELAQCHKLEWDKVDDTMLYGCALKEFSPVHCTLLSVAKLLRWQALYIFTQKGGPQWDTAELAEMAKIARTKFLLVEDFKEAIRRASLMGNVAA